MFENYSYSRAISDLGFYELRRKIDYKSDIYGNLILVAQVCISLHKLDDAGYLEQIRSKAKVIFFFCQRETEPIQYKLKHQPS